MFRELYYWAYFLYSKRKEKRFKGKETSYASWVIGGLMGLNYAILLLIVDYLCILKWHFSFISFLLGREKSFRSFLFAGILLLPVFLYLHYKLDGGKRKIIQHYKKKKMSQFRQDWGILFFWLYVILSIVAVFVAGLIFRKLRSEAGM